MSPDEEKLLTLLLKKQEEEARATGAPVLRLIQGDKPPDSGAAVQLREFLRKVENGEIQQFEIIGLAPGGLNLDARHSHTKSSFEMLGAQLVTLLLRVRSILG